MFHLSAFSVDAFTRISVYTISAFPTDARGGLRSFIVALPWNIFIFIMLYLQHIWFDRRCFVIVFSRLLCLPFYPSVRRVSITKLRQIYENKFAMRCNCSSLWVLWSELRKSIRNKSSASRYFSIDLLAFCELIIDYIGQTSNRVIYSCHINVRFDD